ncbi:AmmeMemoRadiSam system protein A [Rhabdothermincola sediminis]|uniref:AmmeMemoRadiSam system protein A n=1 Tax=Rhabdothermincola sediminis TaxID=2751370 RepID=UPI001AA09413|nr:AmmeMemoRadiSam system protein A [Rhabdothermincola sediminis]
MTAPPELSEQERRALLDTARASIHAGLQHRRLVAPAGYGGSPPLRALGASFVTLRREERLLGCIGTIEPVRPLLADVAHNAYGAAFGDPRLPPVTRDDYHQMTVKVSVLGGLEAMDAADPQALAEQLRPGVDGLLVTAGHRRGTFLPSVWEQIPHQGRFLDLLWDKAGLRPGEWPPDLRIFRYRTVEFGE